MSTKTSIEWCDRSSNPLRAYHAETGKRGWFCVHASPGCEHCYAERRNRWIGNGLHYTAQNLKHVRFEMDAKELHSWARLEPGIKVFVFDMTDLFQQGVPDELIAQAFAAMASAGHVTFQVLTKRADRARVLLGSERFRLLVSQWWKGNLSRRAEDCDVAPYQGQWPLPNVWLGVSVEDQKTADERIPLLLDTPAAVRYVSYEPGLGPINFRQIAVRRERGIDYWNALTGFRGNKGGGYDSDRKLDWVIVGGESGPRARPFDLWWARDTIVACREAGVAVFFKQAGARPFLSKLFDWTTPGWGNANLHLEAAKGVMGVRFKSKKGGDPLEWPEGLRVRQFPRAA